MTDGSSDLFRTIAEYTYDWETWIDEHGVTRWINPAVERITGYSVSECLAMSDYPLRLAYPADRPLLARVLQDAARGGSGNDAEFRVEHKHGSSRWVAISWQSVRARSGAPMGYRTSVRDIDERKHMEQELHVMRRRAEMAAMARSQLLANTSHELRSPVHCIAGFAELLFASRLDDTQRHYVELIAEQCQDMLRQVEDLLQLTAFEAGGVRIERAPFDLEALVQGVTNGARPLARARGLSLECSSELTQRWVEGDAARIKQVLRNLVDNALKFTERGHVRVTARPGRDASCGLDIVELAVEDTGIGMRDEEVARLLEPFQQADPSSRKRQRGVGLGLAICRRAVLAMGGSLHVESERGAGTTVRVVLPLARAEQGLVPSAVSTTSLSIPRGGHVLVVDDSAMARELLTAMLAMFGWTTREAATSEQAVQAITSEPFDLVLLDYQMPDGDGAEAAIAMRRALSARDPERRTPIYLLTANVFVYDQLSSGPSSIDGILAKPLSRASLAALLRSLAVRSPAAPSADAGQAADTTGPGEQRARASDVATLDDRVVGDLAAMHARNGESLLVRALRGVREDLPPVFAALRAALDAHDLRVASGHAHAIAGQAALVGASRLATLARELEDDLRAEAVTDADARQRVDDLEAQWQAVDELLEERIA